MGYLYQIATLVIYPSLVESFGFSLLEAMAFETPVVAADTEINRELCGTAAYYYSPLDSDNAAIQIIKALQSTDTQLLKRNAKIRLNEFDWSWSRYAREFVNALSI